VGISGGRLWPPPFLARPILAAALALLLAHPCGADDARIYDDPAAWENPESVTLSGGELYPDAPFKGIFQSRSFFYTGRLDNGIVFIINLFHWNYSVFNQWGITVLITDPGGRVYKYEGSLPERAKTDPAEGFVFHFGPNLFEATAGGCRIRLALKGFSCDLDIRGILPPWKPGDGWAYYTGKRDEFSRYASPAPWAAVSGRMSVFGEIVSASGQCLWDTCLTVQPLSRTNSLITVFRAFGRPDSPESGRMFISAMVTWTSEKYGPLPVPMLLVARDGKWVFTTKDFAMDSSDWTVRRDPPYPFPRRYTVSARDRGYALEGSFESTRMYHAMDVFESLPPFMRSIASVFLKRPVYFRLIGTFRGKLTTQSGEEIEIDLPAAGEYVILK
jgi:hypothetical protein